jgi:hypothetical protein
MEEEKRKRDKEKKDSEIIFSKAIKAGKRIYYLDVKKSRSNDMFLTITESKKKMTGTNDDTQVVYEKHKIFLYKEDFDSFTKGLEEMISFVKKEQGETPQREERRWSSEIEYTNSDEKEDIKPKSFFDKFKF